MARDADGETPLHEAVWNEVNVVEARVGGGAPGVAVVRGAGCPS